MSRHQPNADGRPLTEPGLGIYTDCARAIQDISVIVRAARRSRGLSLRQTATQAGLAYGTLHRVESGFGCDSYTLVALLMWLDNPQPTPDDASAAINPT